MALIWTSSKEESKAGVTGDETQIKSTCLGAHPQQHREVNKGRVSRKGVSEEGEVQESQPWDFVSDLHSSLTVLRTMTFGRIPTAKEVKVPDFGNSKPSEELN